MKHLPKHLRPKWRYVAVALETDPDESFSRGAFQRELWYATQNLLGDAGSADADGTVVRFQFRNGDGSAVVRARRGEVEAIRAALACVESVDDATVAVGIEGVSGTIRACEEKFIPAATERPDRREVAFAGERRSGIARGDRVAVDVDGDRTYATSEDVE
ncbi:Rpp14/Pop5 family protein [Halorubellus sp. PRR65]|uniref:Rpp14/Pop5 family protein n=1 Tax=Halorubellus sp. PRR65 TaxID=3098148 RepID=UPI002B2618ED|nr:Rpp14/Pop5 family protein [Halorubellus sp. PRR65]